MSKFSEPFYIDPQELKPHKKNKYYFQKLSKKELDELVESMKELGQIDVVVIDEDKVILSGHSRVEAAKKLGQKVLVRTFYADSNEEKVRLLLDANTKRRNLTPVDLKRINKDYLYYLPGNKLLERISPEIKNFIEKENIKLSRELLVTLARVSNKEQKIILKNLDFFIKILPPEERNKINEINKKHLENINVAELDKNETNIKRLEKEMFTLKNFNSRLEKECETYKTYYEETSKKLIELQEYIDNIQNNEQISEDEKKQLNDYKKQYNEIKQSLEKKERENKKKEDKIKQQEAKIYLLKEELNILKEKQKKELQEAIKQVKENYQKMIEEENKKIKKNTKQIIEDKLKSIEEEYIKLKSSIDFLKTVESHLKERINVAVKLKNEDVDIKEFIEKLSRVKKIINDGLSILQED